MTNKTASLIYSSDEQKNAITKIADKPYIKSFGNFKDRIYVNLYTCHQADKKAKVYFDKSGEMEIDYYNSGNVGPRFRNAINDLKKEAGWIYNDYEEKYLTC